MNMHNVKLCILINELHAITAIDFLSTDEFFKVHRCKAPKEWKQNFESYLKDMPLYYTAPLKRALQRMGAPSLVPENMENCLSYSILNYLKRLENQAKSEYEKILLMVGSNKQVSTDSVRISLGIHRPSSHIQKLSDLCLTSNPCLASRFSSLISELNDFTDFNLAVKDKEMKTESYRNPFKTESYRNPFDISG
ncbi:integrator complex subunit 6-like [Tachypleus tridentatus]|uniref:integrator complex subunit 6-like n=1 Tax=Tachypleus tridentatus TaxID=6853 RepID=UPI003FD681E7